MRGTLLAGLMILGIPLAAGASPNTGSPGNGEQDRSSGGSAIGTAHVAQGLAHASQVKTQVAEYYANTGELPPNNAALGLPPPREWSTGALESLEVRDGVIILRFNGKSGVSDGLIRLVPDTRREHLGMQWICQTSDYSLVSGCSR